MWIQVPFVYMKTWCYQHFKTSSILMISYYWHVYILTSLLAILCMCLVFCGLQNVFMYILFPWLQCTTFISQVIKLVLKSMDFLHVRKVFFTQKLSTSLIIMPGIVKSRTQGIIPVDSKDNTIALTGFYFPHSSNKETMPPLELKFKLVKAHLPTVPTAANVILCQHLPWSWQRPCLQSMQTHRDTRRAQWWAA